MSRIFEGLLDGLFGIFNFFENLRVRRGDDETTAEYKRLQSACLASVALLLAVLVAMALVANFVDALEGITAIRLALASPRETLGYAFSGAFLLAMLYAAYRWISLLQFVRKHGTP